MNKPLAVLLAPKNLSEVYGQKHLVAEGKILYNMIKAKKMFSIILYGTPGIGKTSIANAIINELDCHSRFLNAVVNNKKDIDIVIEEAKMYDGLVLVMDEIHRLNKDKQDVLLPALESGLITLIGMTTSNPYHKINPAIRSRCHIFELKSLSTSDIEEALLNACKTDYLKDIKTDDETIKYIATLSGNDLRYAYNIIELAYSTSIDHLVNIDVIKQINSKPVIYHDKNESGHYDLLSAFQKSIRGSDVDASLHYLARLIASGDLDSIYRRMAVIAYEDIGLANPGIGPKVMAAIEASELVGLPEARIPLGTIVTEMALSPKSNTAHIALDMALSDVESGKAFDIPDNIRIDTTTYKYPHDYPGAFVKQQYMPNNLKNKKYYTPKNTGYESSIKNIYDKIENIKKTT